MTDLVNSVVDEKEPLPLSMLDIFLRHAVLRKRSHVPEPKAYLLLEEP